MIEAFSIEELRGDRMRRMAEAFNPSLVVRPSKQVDGKEDSLDGILEHYLHLLHQYQTLQQSLTEYLSKVRF